MTYDILDEVCPDCRHPFRQHGVLQCLTCGFEVCAKGKDDLIPEVYATLRKRLEATQRVLEANIELNNTLRKRLETMAALLDEAWWSRDLHGCRFCFPRSGQFSSADMVHHADDCPYAAPAAGETIGRIVEEHRERGDRFEGDWSDAAAGESET